MERSNSIVVVEWTDPSVVGRVGVLCDIGVGVASGAYSQDGKSVKGEVATAVRYPDEGNTIEGVGDGV